MAQAQTGAIATLALAIPRLYRIAAILIHYVILYMYGTRPEQKVAEYTARGLSGDRMCIPFPGRPNHSFHPRPATLVRIPARTQPIVYQSHTSVFFDNITNQRDYENRENINPTFNNTPLFELKLTNFLVKNM